MPRGRTPDLYSKSQNAPELTCHVEEPPGIPLRIAECTGTDTPRGRTPRIFTLNRRMHRNSHATWTNPPDLFSKSQNAPELTCATWTTPLDFHSESQNAPDTESQSAPKERTKEEGLCCPSWGGLYIYTLTVDTVCGPGGCVRKEKNFIEAPKRKIFLGRA